MTLSQFSSQWQSYSFLPGLYTASMVCLYRSMIGNQLPGDLQGVRSYPGFQTGRGGGEFTGENSRGERREMGARKKEHWTPDDLHGVFWPSVRPATRFKLSTVTSLSSFPSAKWGNSRLTTFESPGSLMPSSPPIVALIDSILDLYSKPCQSFSGIDITSKLSHVPRYILSSCSQRKGA